MKLNWNWVKRRFWDFRHGHGMYLSYALSLINFVTITYHLLISNVDFLKTIFSHWWMYAAIFIVLYPPLAIVIGYSLHRKKQLPTEQEIAMLANPFLYKAQPGKERLLSLPINLLWLRLIPKLAESHDLLTPQDKREIERLNRLVETLLAGKNIKG